MLRKTGSTWFRLTLHWLDLPNDGVRKYGAEKPAIEAVDSWPIKLKGYYGHLLSLPLLCNGHQNFSELLFFLCVYVCVCDFNGEKHSILI